jgi:hypothetical protein
MNIEDQMLKCAFAPIEWMCYTYVYMYIYMFVYWYIHLSAFDSHFLGKDPAWSGIRQFLFYITTLKDAEGSTFYLKIPAKGMFVWQK